MLETLIWLVIHLLMAVMDAAWWVIALRLAKRKRWRILLSVFMAFQLAAHLSLMCGLDWRPYLPQIVFLSVVAWHFFGLGALLLLGIARTTTRILRAFRRVKTPPGKLPDAAPANSTNAPSLTRREFIGACAALAPPLFTIGMTGFTAEQMSRLRVRSLTLPIPTLPRALDGLTIAQISDIHLGGLTSGRILRKMVETTNSLRPDLVLLTGDLINFHLSELPEGISLVQSMPGRYGQWMIEGNHDVFDDGDEFDRRVKASGIPLLVNDSAVAQVRGHPIQLFGLAWLGGNHRERDLATATQLREVLKQRQPDAFPILLAHHPHAFDAAAELNLPLTLSGHTHGGFWMLGDHHGIGPTFFRYWSGLYTRRQSHLIVSNGIGNWNSLPPIRINAPSEIIHLTLRSASA